MSGRSLPPTWTEAVPSLIRWKPAAPPPCSVMSLPCSWYTMRAWDAIDVRAFLPNPANRSVAPNASTISGSAAMPAPKSSRAAVGSRANVSPAPRASNGDRVRGMPDLSPRREQLMRAATRVTAEQGLRGLTHRAVDREAGVSMGSCSAYYRTRAALQEGLAQYVASTAAADVTALTEELRACPPDDDRKVELTSRMFLRWLAERDLLPARLELELAATRDTRLAAVLTAWRATLVGVVAAIAAERGLDDADERAEALVASADGILLAALVRPVRGRRAFVTSALGRLMGRLTEPV